MTDQQSPVHDLQSPRRVVVIVGRPNVGKSALFNRLAGGRISIVHSESGVTRDRVLRTVTWGEQRFDLVDTGGLCMIDRSKAQDAIEAGIRRQVEAAMADAAVAIFVVDVEAGTVPMDEEVARLLRASGCRTVIAANKADHAGRDDRAAEFERFGFPVFPVSALHDRGFEELMGSVLDGLPAGPAAEALSALKVTIIGRPNVGKSSFVNRVLCSDRVIVSSVPGTTRDSIDVPFSIGAGGLARHYILTDTAGIRPVQKVSMSVEKFSVMRAEQSIERADVVVHVFDAVQGPTAQDKKIAAMILEHEKGCVRVVNKWDLAGETTQRKYEPALNREVPFMTHCPVVFASAKTGYNIRRCVEAVDYVATQTRATLPTGVLNRAILDAVERVGPPSVGGRWLKVLYATQVGTAPVRVRMFVNEPGLVKPAYHDYLVRSLREKFGLEGAPIRLVFSARRRKEEGSRQGRARKDSTTPVDEE